MNSARAMMELKQTGSANAYSTRFRQLASHADLDEQAQIVLFLRELKPEVQEQLLPDQRRYGGRWPDIQTLSNAAITADSGLFDIANASLLKAASVPRTGGYQRTYQSTGPVPMDVSATTTPGSPSKLWRDMNERERAAEKERRRRFNLCFWCGSAGHKASECGPTRVAAVSQSTSSLEDRAFPGFNDSGKAGA